MMDSLSGSLKLVLFQVQSQLYGSHTVRNCPWQDLTKLNRDPRRVLYLSSKPESVVQQENLVRLPEWEATDTDTALLDLLPFLECECSRAPPHESRNSTEDFPT